MVLYGYQCGCDTLNDVEKRGIKCDNRSKAGKVWGKDMGVKENRMFSQMLSAATERLLRHNCEEIAKNSNAVYNKEEKAFVIETLGKTVRIKYPEFSVMPNLNEWHQLVILHYLDLADGSSVENTLISFSQMKDGLIRGGDFDRRFEKTMQLLLKTLSADEFKEKCLALGGRIIPTNADLSVEFLFLPRFPVTLKVWFADEDFEASARMMLDASAEHYLTIEDAVTVGEFLLERLRK